jgi:hypothetical protein
LLVETVVPDVEAVVVDGFAVEAGVFAGEVVDVILVVATVLLVLPVPATVGLAEVVFDVFAVVGF